MNAGGLDALFKTDNLMTRDLIAQGTQRLRDNAQTVTWLHQLGTSMTLDTVAYRRSATAALDALTARPLAATQDRELDHQGLNVALSYSGHGHQLKTGVQYDRNPLTEHFRMTGVNTAGDPVVARFDPTVRGGRAFVFDGRDVGQNIGRTYSSASAGNLRMPSCISARISAGVRSCTVSKTSAMMPLVMCALLSARKCSRPSSRTAG